ncbi:tyrosine-type recombinase/integrase [Pseudomonadales bacterium]|nr:tyrosine-type recombinase/integrase [Pseudomonadales bacterium]
MGLKSNGGVKGYAKQPPGKHSYGDGLELHVSATGKSVWKLRDRKGGRDTTTKIGDAHSIHNVHWARSRVEEHRAGVVVASDSIGAALTDWARTKLVSKRWSGRHHQKTLARLEKHCASIWSTPVESLTRPVIVKALETVSDIDSAGRVYSWIHDCLESMVDRGELAYCVLGRKPQSLTLPAGQSRRRKSYGSDYAALAELYRAVRLSNSARSVRLAGQLSILSGLRLGEVLALRTEYVRDDRIVVPRALMKIKDRSRPDFVLPISAPQLKAVVVDAAEAAVDGWLFPSPRSGKPVSREAVEKMFRSLSNSRHQPHGSRTSIRTYAMEVAGVRSPVAQSLLDHLHESGVAAHYDRTQYLDERAIVLAEWCDLIAPA